MKLKTILILSLCVLFAFGYTNLSTAQSSKILKTNGQEFKHTSRKKDQITINNNSCYNMQYRTIDGTCNNFKNKRTDFGASEIPLYREMSPLYGFTDHYNAMGGANRPSPRAVSNNLCVQSGVTEDNRGLSSFVFTWGQFIDHDISLTPEGHTEYEPITMPADEPLFVNDIPFFRSEVYEDSGDGNYRQQTNLITSWIDASNVYGSDEDRANWLRTFKSGKLKMSSGDLLPFNTVDGEYDSAIDTNAPSMAGDGGGQVKTFVAGDIRAAEQPGLTSLHTLFVREHNRICDRLRKDGIKKDEQAYQMARKEVGAIIQAITYNEFLPALGVRLKPIGRYNPGIQPDISNIFATAAYRLGHTMVTDELLLKNDNCSNHANGSVSLLEGFFNPEVLRTNNIAPILNGLAVQTQNEVDTKIIDNLRNFLFGDPSSPNAVGLDLASLNIQRGRDHGLPDYNTARRHYTWTWANTFNDISSKPEIRAALQNTYSDVENIDLWVGLLAEDKVPGTALGKTLHAIMKKQFEKLREGDRYFYLNDRYLSSNDKKRIDNIKLADVIKKNTNINYVQSNVFFSRYCPNTRGDVETEIRTVESPVQEFTLAPNPGLTFIDVILDQQIDEGTAIFIYDINGQLLMQKSLTSNRTKIDINSLPPGTYIATLLAGDVKTSKRFIKIK